MNKREVGKKGEEIACKFLENSGIKIIKKNYHTKYGEIDLIGIENKTIIFIEVKLRNNESFGHPIEAINFKKVEKIKKTAVCFLYENEFKDSDFRFDVINLLYDESKGKYCINWLQKAIF